MSENEDVSDLEMDGNVGGKEEIRRKGHEEVLYLLAKARAAKGKPGRQGGKGRPLAPQ